VLIVRFVTDASGRTRFERIYRRISDYDPKVIFRRLSARKVANTNKWLACRDDFQSWLRGGANSQSHLWLSGKGRECGLPYGDMDMLTRLRSWLRKEHPRVSQIMAARVRGVLTIPELPSSTSVSPNLNLATARPCLCSSSRAKKTQPFRSSRA
jgi:hypothetical protein